MPRDQVSEPKEIDFSNIGYYGRPITDLNKEDLLSAFAELVAIYKACKRKNERCKEVLGAEKFESL